MLSSVRCTDFLVKTCMGERQNLLKDLHLWWSIFNCNGLSIEVFEMGDLTAIYLPGSGDF